MYQVKEIFYTLQGEGMKVGTRTRPRGCRVQVLRY